MTKNEKIKTNTTIWRWHFYMGVFVIPFMIILSLSGLAMMYIGYFDGRDGEKIVIDIPDDKKMVSLEQQKIEVLRKYPNAKVLELIKAPAKNKVNVFRIKTKDTQEMIAINPYNLQILENWQRRKGWYDVADTIHGDLYIGKTGDALLEISSGFGILLIITGVYLYIPKRKKIKNMVLSKKLHIYLGLGSCIFLFLFLLTGLSWTGVWGAKIVQPWNSFPEQKWDNVPLSNKTHASLNNTNVEQIPWGLEQTKLPISVNKGNNTNLIDIDFIEQTAKNLGFEGRYRISFPKKDDGVWTINQDTMSSDFTDPFGDKTVHIDQYSGKILAKAYFVDYSFIAKIMAVSIPLHMGLITIWNLIINTIICLIFIAISITGFMLWWERKPNGFTMGAPKKTNSLSDTKKLAWIMVIVGIIFPLSGITMLLVYLLDKFVISKISSLKTVFN